MKTATVRQLKTELNNIPQQDLVELCLRLSKFKKENKEMLTYLLFESSYEDGYIEAVQLEVDAEFNNINTSSYFYMKKSVRKILRTIKKYIRYSKKKETEIELLLYFCSKMKDLRPSITRNTVLNNIFIREMASIEKKLLLLHEDLQFDYGLKLKELQ